MRHVHSKCLQAEKQRAHYFKQLTIKTLPAILAGQAVANEEDWQSCKPARGLKKKQKKEHLEEKCSFFCAYMCSFLHEVYSLFCTFYISTCAGIYFHFLACFNKKRNTHFGTCFYSGRFQCVCSSIAPEAGFCVSDY